MKRTEVYSRSYSSPSYQNGGDDHTPPSLTQQPRRQVDFSHNTYPPATSPPFDIFTRSASLTDIPTPNDDGTQHHHDIIDRSLSHDDGTHHHHDIIDRSLSHASGTRSLAADGFLEDAPVFRSVAVHHGLSADPWRHPPQLSKATAWPHGFSDKSNTISYSDYNNSSSHGHGFDISMKPPSFGEDRTQRHHNGATDAGATTGGVGEYTTFETLQAVCLRDPGDIIPQPVPDYVEPHCNFELLATPSAVVLSIGRFLDDRNIVFHFDASECQFEARALTNGFQFAFHVAVFDQQRERHGEEVQCLVEFQRRQGDCLQFDALYGAAKEHLVHKLSDKANSEQHAEGEGEGAGGDDESDDMDQDVRLQCAVLLADNIPDDNEFSPSKAIPEAGTSMLSILNEMINSNHFEEQYEATSIVARLTAASEANCRVILHDEASVNGLLASLVTVPQKQKRDLRVQLFAATSVANLVSQPEHVPRGSLNVIVMALINLLLQSSSLEVVRETARALVSIADLSQEFELKITQLISAVLEKLDATRDKVAVGYRTELARKVGVPSTPY